ncbi:MAG: aspartate 1-decarboxylase [Candidatus Aminicenantales bacterium]
MGRIMLEAKIHRARVTETNLDYEGSLTLDESLMEAAGMVPYEQVHVYNMTNGERFQTYLIKGEKDSGVVGVNGAAAHKAKVGDELIIATYAVLDEEKTGYFTPKIILVDEKNRVKLIK